MNRKIRSYGKWALICFFAIVILLSAVVEILFCCGGPDWLVMVLGTLISLLFALGEEIGWRGSMVPALYERLGLNKALLISSLFWCCWHLPLLIGGHPVHTRTETGEAPVKWTHTHAKNAYMKPKYADTI